VAKHLQTTDVLLSDGNIDNFKKFLKRISLVDAKKPFRFILREALGFPQISSLVFPMTTQSDFAKGQKVRLRHAYNQSDFEPKLPLTVPDNIPRLRRQANKTKAVLDKYITENKHFTSGEYNVPSIKYDTLIKLRAIAPYEDNTVYGI
jgi:hypothetical protein